MVSDVKRVCTAYEQGFGKGVKLAPADIPYATFSEEQRAWSLGYDAGRSRRAADDAEAAAFKNFHRSLCHRFGYVHDEKDWRRDLVSLEEHIAQQVGQPVLSRPSLRSLLDAAVSTAELLRSQIATLDTVRLQVGAGDGQTFIAPETPVFKAR